MQRQQLGTTAGALVDTVYREFDRVDVLINNAGLSPLYSSVDQITEAYFDKVIGVNLKGPFRLAAAIGTRMAAADGGSIINISSIEATLPDPARSPVRRPRRGSTTSPTGWRRPSVRTTCGSTRFNAARSSPTSPTPGPTTCVCISIASQPCAAVVTPTKSPALHSISQANDRHSARAQCCGWTAEFDDARCGRNQQAIRGVELSALAGWMDTQGLETGPLTSVRPIGGGTQNIMVRFSRSTREFVIRRGPIHPRKTTNANLLREMRLLTALAGTTVPHSRLIATCDDESVLGESVFYLMEPVEGFNAGVELPPLHASREEFGTRWDFPSSMH